MRTSGQFSLEQADAPTEALAAALINLEDHKIEYREPAPAPEHNKTTAALLAIFLGDFGAHKFYLGQCRRFSIFDILLDIGQGAVRGVKLAFTLQQR